MSIGYPRPVLMKTWMVLVGISWVISLLIYLISLYVKAFKRFEWATGKFVSSRKWLSHNSSLLVGWRGRKPSCIFTYLCSLLPLKISFVCLDFFDYKKKIVVSCKTINSILCHHCLKWLEWEEIPCEVDPFLLNEPCFKSTIKLIKA